MFTFLFQVVPTGFANLLRWCKSSYNDPPIYITENGFSDLGTLDDYGRIKYYNVSNSVKYVQYLYSSTEKRKDKDRGEIIAVVIRSFSRKVVYQTV